MMFFDRSDIKRFLLALNGGLLLSVASLVGVLGTAHAAQPCAAIVVVQPTLL